MTPTRRSFLLTPLALQAQQNALPPPFPWRVPEIQTAPFTYPAVLDAAPVRFWGAVCYRDNGWNCVGVDIAPSLIPEQTTRFARFAVWTSLQDPDNIHGKVPAAEVHRNLEMLVHTEPLLTNENTPILDLWEFYVITAPIDANGTRWNDKLLLALIVDNKGRIILGSDPREGFSWFDVYPAEQGPGYVRIKIVGGDGRSETFRYTPASGRLTPEKPPARKTRSQPSTKNLPRK